MDEELKRRIIHNRFAFELRVRFRLDQEAFGQLCADLKLLADQWRRARLIDKELVHYLIVDLLVVRESAQALERSVPDAWDAYTEFNRLVVEEVLRLDPELQTYQPFFEG